MLKTQSKMGELVTLNNEFHKKARKKLVSSRWYFHDSRKTTIFTKNVKSKPRDSRPAVTPCQ